MIKRPKTAVSFLFLIVVFPVQICFCNGPITKKDHFQITNVIDVIHDWKNKHDAKSSKLPFITLSYAQSLDGKIALCESRDKDGYMNSSSSSNLPISGIESLHLTHALRSVHDGIVVGGKTLFIDNPRLSNRLWGNDQPRPIILDPYLKYIQQLGKTRKVKNAIVCCSEDAKLDGTQYDNNLMYLRCKMDKKGRLLDLLDVFQQLKSQYNIRSIMVEGGATVISSLVSQRLVDCVCLTIAPKFIGQQQGLSPITSIPENESDYRWIDLVKSTTAANSSTQWFALGSDCIFLAAWPEGYIDKN